MFNKDKICHSEERKKGIKASLALTENGKKHMFAALAQTYSKCNEGIWEIVFSKKKKGLFPFVVGVRCGVPITKSGRRRVASPWVSGDKWPPFFLSLSLSLSLSSPATDELIEMGKRGE